MACFPKDWNAACFFYYIFHHFGAFHFKYDFCLRVLFYDVLRKHQPDHLLLRCARADAAVGMLDIRRLGDFLQRIVGKIEGINLPKVSPFAVPVMMEIGREAIAGAAQEAILEAAAFDLISEALS